MFKFNQQANSESLYLQVYSRFVKNKVALVCLFILALLVLLVVMAPWFSPYRYDETNFGLSQVAPNLHNWFGTDSLGRDLFTRTMVGGRTTFLIAFIATLVSVFLGTIYGSIAGYVGGWLDSLMMRIVDILYSLPFLFFAILLVTFFGRNFILIFVAIGAVSWLDMSRVVRGQTMSLKHKIFIEAAQISGLSQIKIIAKHIIPNLIGIVAVYTTLTVPTVIVISAFLSFLGLGVQEPMTSWGLLISDGAANLTSWWLVLFPGLFLVLTLLCFNFVGNGLRDALDPREHR